MIPAFTQIQRAKVAADLAAAYEKLQEFDQAYAYYRLAARLESNKAVKTDLLKKRDEVHAIMQRLAANRLRAPQIHKELNQGRPVAPRLALRALSQSTRNPGGAL
jgi:hypothetical protein